MSEKRKIEGKDIRVSPTMAITKSKLFGTIAADYAKCTLNTDTNVCTLTFFQSHPIPKIEARGILLESIEDEMRLEVKMPMETAFALALFMVRKLDEVTESKKGKKPKAIIFGPSRVLQKGKSR